MSQDSNQTPAGSNSTWFLLVYSFFILAYAVPEFQRQKADLEVRRQGAVEAMKAEQVLDVTADTVQAKKEERPASTGMKDAKFGETMPPFSQQDDARQLLGKVEDIRNLGVQLNQEMQQIRALEQRLQMARSQEEGAKLYAEYQQKVGEMQSGRAIYQSRVDQVEAPLKDLASKPDVSREVRLAHAFIQGELGNYAEKITVMEAEQKQKPLSLQEGLDLVFTYEQVNRLSEAVKTLENLSGLSDLSTEEAPQIKAMLAQQYFWTEEFDKALAVYEELSQVGSWASLIAQPKQNAMEAKALFDQEMEFRKSDKDQPKAEIVTSKGRVLVELFEDDAPNAVANFITLAESKFYDGQKFHRVIPKFMAQGGDPNSKDEDPGNDGSGGPGYTIKTEISRRNHMRGSLSYANAGINTDGSQFFLTVVPTFWLNGKHAVFGRVLEGMSIVDSLQVGDEIQSVTILSKRNKEYTVTKN